MEDVVVLVVCGVSGAGKTTIGRLLAERLGWDFRDADDFHPPANVRKMRQGTPLSDEDRTPWLQALHALVEQNVAAGRPLVLACSALKVDHRRLLGIDQHRVVSVFLDGSKALISARLTSREHAFMPSSLLDSQFETLEPPDAGIHVAIDAAPEVVVRRIETALRAF